MAICSCGPAPYSQLSAPVVSLHAVDSESRSETESRTPRSEDSQPDSIVSSFSDHSSSVEVSQSSDSRYDDIEKRLEEQERYERERDEIEDEYRERAEERERQREQRRRDRERDRERERERKHERCEAERKAQYLRENKAKLQEALKKKFGK